MEYDQQQDIVYGYKDGMALVMDVYTPKSPNGAGVIWVAAGGWREFFAWRRDAFALGPGEKDPHHPVIADLLKALFSAGYVIFAVSHSSRPRYTIDDLRPDMPRAVRYIRHHAEDFDIHPQRIGILGGSSGGHVSLMTATDPPPPDEDAEDPIDRESSEVQAVVSYFPPTDLVNFGGEGTNVNDFTNAYFMRNAEPPVSNSPLDFHQWDEEGQRYERVNDPAERLEYFRRNSPIEYLSANMPPVLLLHGDEDELVPIQQSGRLVARMKELDIVHKLVVLTGLGHAYPEAPENGHTEFLAWFGQYLLERDT